MTLKSDESIHIKNPEMFEAKIARMASAADRSLQVIADFDGTITFHKTSSNQLKRGLSCHGVIGKYPGLTAEYRADVQAMEDHFGPLEKDPGLSPEDRLQVMTDWWARSHGLMIAQQISMSHIDEMVRDAKSRGLFGLRDKAADFLHLLRSRKIPCVVLSAGIAVVIEELLDMESIPVDDLTMVVSNQTIADANGIIQAFVEPVIHGLSKRQVLKGVLDSSITRRDRRNVLLLGDMPHDVEAALAVEDRLDVLSIGFLHDIKHLEDYMALYDIVLTDDQGYDNVISILNKLIS